MVSTLEIICLLQLWWRYVTRLTTMHKYLFLMKLDEPSSFSFPFAHYFTGSVSIPFLFYPYFVRYLEIAFSEKFICFRCFLSVLLNVIPKKKKQKKQPYWFQILHFCCIWLGNPQWCTGFLQKKGISVCKETIDFYYYYLGKEQMWYLLSFVILGIH